MNQQRVQYLVEQFIINQLTVEEQQEFHSLLHSPEHYPGVVTAFETRSGEVYASKETDETVMHLLHRAPMADRPAIVEEAPVHHISFMRRWGWAAAAVLILLSAGMYFWSSNILVNRRSQLSQVQQQKDVAPGRDGAVLTLADGSKIVLDSLGNGTIANQNGTDVVLNNGQLKYESGSEKTNAAQQWNTMHTPKGRQFNVTLPDGTRVWLNAASSLTYPTAFTGNERNVQLTGEAYFEVAKNKAMPFKVLVNSKAAIEVLGTHFNINGYTDEDAIRTTLLEGSVKIVNGQWSMANGKTAVLKPGEQAEVRANSPLTIDHSPDLDKVMAWRNGAFNFEGASLQEVMRQLARWYDIEVVYEKGIPEISFVGEMSRDITLSGVLKALEASNVHFRLEDNRRLIVLP